MAAVGPFHATDIIVAFKYQYPNRSFMRLLDFEADVGLIAEVHPHPRVRTIPYSTHHVVVFVNSSHPFFNRDSISIDELQGQKVVQREVDSTTRTAVDRALLRAVSIHDVPIRTQYFLAHLEDRQHARLIRAFCDIATGVPDAD